VSHSDRIIPEETSKDAADGRAESPIPEREYEQALRVRRVVELRDEPIPYRNRRSGLAVPRATRNDELWRPRMIRRAMTPANDGWITGTIADERILEYLSQTETSTPKKMADSGDFRFSRQYIGEDVAGLLIIDSSSILGIVSTESPNKVGRISTVNWTRRS